MIGILNSGKITGIINVAIKLLLAVLGVFLTVIGVKWLIQKYWTKGQTDETAGVVADVKNFDKVGMKQTYANSFYEDLAAQFFEKFKDYDYVTKAGVSDIMPYLKRLQNYLDFLQFKKAFGIREERFSKYTLSEFVIEYFDDLAEASYNGYVRGLLKHAQSKGVKFN